MASLRRKFPSLFSVPAKNSICPCLNSFLSIAAELIHSDREPNFNTVVNSICDSFRRGWNWDTLTRKFEPLELNNSLIEKVLLELKEPTDAKRALGFFHWSAKRKSFEHGVRSYCLIVHILVRARLIMDARALLESLLKKSVGKTLDLSVADSLLSTYEAAASSPFVFDMLVQAYSKLRLVDVALSVCCHLEEHGFFLSLISFNTVIHVIEKSDEFHMVWEVYEHMIMKRIYPNEVTVRIMISALCKEGRLQEFVDMLDRIHGKRCSPSVIVNTSMIFRIFDKKGRVEEGIMLLKRMLQKNMVHDTIAYSLIVYAKLNLGNSEDAVKVFDEMLKRGFQLNPFLYTLFIGARCREGKIGEANCLMEEMDNMGLKPYGETFNHLIEGFAKAGCLEESFRYCEKMVERGILPSCAAFNVMTGKLCESGDVKKANAMVTILIDKGFLPDEITFSHLINGYGQKGEIQEMLKLYYEMESRSISPNLSFFSSMIRSFCKSEKLEEAEKYFQIMKDRSLSPDLTIYETLIRRHLEKGNRERALKLHEEMMSAGLEK